MDPKLLRCEFVMRSDGTLSILAQDSGQQTTIYRGERFWLDIPAEQVYTLMKPQPKHP